MTTITAAKMSAIIDDAGHSVTWRVAPRDQGQMVERATALIDGERYERTTDRSTGEVTYRAK